MLLQSDPFSKYQPDFRFKRLHQKSERMHQIIIQPRVVDIVNDVHNFSLFRHYIYGIGDGGVMLERMKKYVAKRVYY